MLNFKKFIKDILSEENGKYSITRFTQLLLVVSFLISFFYIMYKENTLADIPINLAGLIWLLYTTNKVSSTLSIKDAVKKLQK